MLSHGVVSGALFLCVGVVYDRLHTREIARYGGLVNNMPRYAVAFMLFMLASVGLPGTSGFVGEFLVMIGAFRANTWVAFLATTGIILGAAYMLWLYRRVIFGKLTQDDVKGMLDLQPARGGDLRAAGPDRAVDGHLSRPASSMSFGVGRAHSIAATTRRARTAPSAPASRPRLRRRAIVMIDFPNWLRPLRRSSWRIRRSRC